MSRHDTALVEIEAVMLASLMASPSLMTQVTLREDDFADERHRVIFALIRDQQMSGESCDSLTVAELLEQQGKAKGVVMYCVGLGVDRSSGNALGMAQRIQSRARMRRAQEIGETLAVCAEDGQISKAITALMDLHREDGRHEHTLKSALRATMDEVAADYAAGGKIRGVTSGIKKIDQRLGGWHAGDLIIVGARPSMGKTALAVNFIAAATKADHGVGVISAEQPAVQIAGRHLALESNVAASKLRAVQEIREEEWPSLTQACASLGPSKYWLYDRSAPSLDEVGRIARKWKHVHGIDALYVDYLQRLRLDGGSDNRWERVGDIARGLKNLARDLNIPVIALAQVNRAVEQRANQRPRMGDLADSSELEKEADVIVMLYRDEVANPDGGQKGTAELLIEKNRHGPVGVVHCAFVAETMRFADLEDRYDFA